MPRLFILALALLASPALAQPPAESDKPEARVPDTILDYADISLSERPTNIDPLEPYYGFIGKQESKWRIGDIGRLPIGEGIDEVINVKAFQILGKNELLVMYKTTIDTTKGTIKEGKVTSYNPYRSVEHLFWLADYPTKGIADGDQIKLEGPIEVIGTETYETDDGDTTVKKVKRVDLSQYDDLFTVKHLAKTWIDATGKHETKAFLMGYERGQVTLKSPEGKVTKVKLSSLSKDDQAFVRQWVKDQKPMKR